MYNPGISIVIPAYNEESFLPNTLASIYSAIAFFHKSTGGCAEVIVVNNQSTDQTVEIAKKFGAKIIHHQKRNIASVRNAGITNAENELIVTIDADCRIPQDTLTLIQQKMQDPKIVGAGLGVDFITNKKSLQVLAFLIQKIVHFFSNVQGGMICFRKMDAMKIGGFPEDRLFAEDVAFGIAMKKHAKTQQKKFTYFHDIRIETLDRKEVHLRDMANILFYELRIFFGHKPTAEDYKYWYKPRR